MKKSRKIFIGILVAITLVVGGILYYINDYYHGSPSAINTAETMIEKDGNLVFENTSDSGFIIYPGGKVDERAYSKLAQDLYKEGYTVIILKAPFRLSILDSKAAGGAMKDYPKIENWYIVGHSLGGTSASMFANSQPERVQGIVFLGSYPYKSIKEIDGFALSIVGSEDQVINRQKAKETKDLYPKNATFKVIEGGNHALFGEYGKQSGDGKATISGKEQREKTLEYILAQL